MSDKIVDLAIAVKTLVEATAGITIQRRYVPHFDPADIVNPTWVLLIAQDDFAKPGRVMADNELSVDLALQQALPERVNRNDDPIPTAWCDARVRLLGQIKALFSPGGDLYTVQPLVGFEFRGFSNNPIYIPDLLLDNGIFTGVIRLTFMGELNAD